MKRSTARTRWLAALLLLAVVPLGCSGGGGRAADDGGDGEEISVWDDMVWDEDAVWN